MENSFVEYFRKFSFLHLEDLQVLYSLARIRTVQKGEVLMEAGHISYDVHVVLKGLLRAYNIRSDGSERTLGFALAGMEMASPASLFDDQPSIASIEALESSVILSIDSRKFEELAKKYPRLTRMQNQSLKKNMVLLVQRIECYVILSPEERFLYIQQHQPELLQRVPQKHLASYIGVTTVSLSRMKTRIANRKN